jgi:hypothetical protein
MQFMKAFTLAFLCTVGTTAAAFGIKTLDSSGMLTVTNAFTNGVVSIEKAATLSGPWTPDINRFSTDAETQLAVELLGSSTFLRAVAADLNGPAGFTNLVESYSILTTVAGAGGSTSAGVNKWRPEFEHAPATNAQLSRPHISMADPEGNIFVADKDAHGIRKITPDGTIMTVAGTSSAGDGPDVSTPGTFVALNEPNGLWVAGTGVVYILDFQKGKIRRLARDGSMQTLFAVPGGISSGRGLWVSDDESIAYVSSGTILKKWTPAGGVVNLVSGFSQLGNLAIDHRGSLVVTDRNANRVYRIAADGFRTVIAGNGSTSGGGDGQLATATGLAQVRAVWFLPTGAFFVGTDSGAQVWYVDTDGIIHLFLNGTASNAHAGDGTWFYQPTEARTGPIRAITTDRDGNLLITEHDAGYVRKIRFQPHLP